MESSSNKKYGLIVPKKLSDLPKKISNVFGDDSDSENETSKKHIQTNNQTKAQQRSVKLSIDKALKEDATVFQYDEVYDDMEKKKEHTNEKKKNVKPRYIQNLLVQAEKRKVEYERRNERLIQKEREAEGDQFKDKEAFVTASYKAKLEELRKLDEEDLKFSMIEDINDVTKQKDMGSFYRHLFKEELCKNENDKTDEVKKSTKKPDASRQYRKRASSNTSDDDNANDDRDTDLSESDSSVDSKRRKIESHDDKKSVGENAEPEVKLKESTIEIGKVKDTAPNEEPKPTEKTKETPKDKKVEKNESKPKEIKPKINIWLKRTVGNIFEEARQRYFQRQMTNLQCVRT
jgi:coiled-coil domain-containing protein 55